MINLIMRRTRTALVRGAVLALVVWMAGLVIVSCATVGREFPVEQVDRITIGETTQSDIQEMFGSPWRVGIEDGLTTWTYGKYRYSLFGKSNSEDLVIRFDANNVVVSYSFNTTKHDE